MQIRGLCINPGQRVGRILSYGVLAIGKTNWGTCSELIFLWMSLKEYYFPSTSFLNATFRQYLEKISMA